MLTELDLLYLHENQLNDTLPTETGMLPQLNELEIRLGKGVTTGPIPMELGQLISLTLFQNGTLLTELGLSMKP